MRKILLTITILTASIASSFAQRTINEPNAEKRDVGSFHGVEVGSGIDLYLSPGDETVVVTASEIRFRDRIKTEVRNGILKIWYDYKSNFRIDGGNRKMKAYVSFKQLDRVEGSGGSDVYVDGVIKSDKLDLEVSGGSDFKGKVSIAELRISASGGSDVNISGDAKNAKIDASGGSDCRAYDLITETCDLQASGGSDLYITVNKEMVADASGGSDIYYKGSGVIRDIRSSGSSGVKRVTK
ncbi:MAG: head GIN domain-containing protein [Chitinophagaceae bacterium]